jgi:hypothetical protein
MDHRLDPAKNQLGVRLANAERSHDLLHPSAFIPHPFLGWLPDRKGSHFILIGRFLATDEHRFTTTF